MIVFQNPIGSLHTKLTISLGSPLFISARTFGSTIHSPSRNVSASLFLATGISGFLSPQGGFVVFTAQLRHIAGAARTEGASVVIPAVFGSFPPACEDIASTESATHATTVLEFQSNRPNLLRVSATIELLWFPSPFIHQSIHQCSWKNTQKWGLRDVSERRVLIDVLLRIERHESIVSHILSSSSIFSLSLVASWSRSPGYFVSHSCTLSSFYFFLRFLYTDSVREWHLLTFLTIRHFELTLQREHYTTVNTILLPIMLNHEYPIYRIPHSLLLYHPWLDVRNITLHYPTFSTSWFVYFSLDCRISVALNTLHRWYRRSQ